MQTISKQKLTSCKQKIKIKYVQYIKINFKNKLKVYN